MARWLDYLSCLCLISVLFSMVAADSEQECQDETNSSRKNNALLQVKSAVESRPGARRKGHTGRNAGVHVRQSDAHAVAGTAGTLRNMQWLHFPKAGTSFIATLWNYACGQGNLPLDLNVDPNASAKCGRCYDFALMDRYPKQEYCASGVLAKRFQTQHRPSDASWMVAEETVAFFRRPNQRLISAHRDGLHSTGFGESQRQVLAQTCAYKNASCYVRFPGIAGCMTRMLTGSQCAHTSELLEVDDVDASEQRISQQRVSEAVEAIGKLRFVGLTEEWDESVCLFHRMFGGRVSPMELKNFHHHKALGGVLDPSSLEIFRDDTAGYDEAELDGFKDEEDEAVYAAAVSRFRELQGEYGGAGDHTGSSCHAEFSVPGVYLLGGTSGGSVSCPQAGVQCGPMMGMLDCGSCPSWRLRDLPGGPHDLFCNAEGQCSVPGLNVSSTFAWFREKKQ